MRIVNIGNRKIGEGQPCFIVAEIGINHNGNLNTAFTLINKAKEAGCDAVKFQKRTVDVVYSKEELEAPRENPFGVTNGDLKRGLEFGEEEYKEIDAHCKSNEIMWFASCWDEQAVDFIDKFDPPCYKIASASLTDDVLLRHTVNKGKPIILSTGMSTMDEINHAVEVLDIDNLIILHCTSTYPGITEELNLNVISTLRNKFGFSVGFSGHERALCTTIATISMRVCMVERHITLDRTMWGSDQAASVEPQGMEKLVRDCRQIEKAMGSGKKVVYKSEVPIREKLRRK